MPKVHCSPSECDKSGSGKNEICMNTSESKTSISACSCGPECGPEKCDGRNRSVLVGWDSLRSRVFLCLFAAFIVWLVVYVPLSLTVLKN